ncbi:MAG: zincin-like metallopeptidase domain-containing protein [Reyranellaceae bacterium]
MDTVLSKAKGTGRHDVYETITSTIIAAIEAGAGTWHMPWHSSDAPLHRPRNVVSGLPYKGVNILVLWAEGQLRNFGTGLWATYRQWQELGAQVRKGERGTTVLYYKQLPLEAEDAETGEIVRDYRLIARAFTVFNGAQVDGWKPWDPEPVDIVETHRVIEDFIDATGADIWSAGDKAYFDRMGNCIFIPDRIRFRGSPTSSATEGYYATVFHELVHWTGHHLRLSRDLSGRYRSEAYAMEELVAELGAAYLCMEFGVANVPRPDHAAYIANWLTVLKGDKRAILAASTHANQAVEFLLSN